MAEKTGETIKLEHPYNTAGCLEIYNVNQKEWYRVTARDFRSFDGKRRITEPTEIELGNVDVPMTTYEYVGPVYVYGTNNQVLDCTGEGVLITSPYWEKMHKVSGSRG
jgi:hypothetical protein